jgi:ferric-dicitrate binding protein FerR (iron transport regulator)
MLKNKEILIGKYLSGNANADEAKILTDWLKENPENQVEFDRIEKLWSVSANLKKESHGDVDAAWEEFKSLSGSTKTLFPTRTNYRYLKVAAAITLFICMGVLIRVFFMDTVEATPVAAKPASALPSTVDTISEEEYEYTFDELDTMPVESYELKQVGKKRVKRAKTDKSIAMITIAADDSAKIFILPDNSIVYLNTHSKLTYPENFSKSLRRVSLDGEAFFEVAKDSNQFVIACHNTITRGSAASFNVRGYEKDKNVEVLVVSGTAEFSGVGSKEFKKLTLATGEKGTLTKDQSSLVKSKVTRRDVKWWQSSSLKARIKRFFDKLRNKLK